MDNQIEEVKKRIDIVDFIGGFITLKKSGRNYKALCPFHQEKSPSFIVSPDRQIWHCFGACSEGGDVIKFLMKWENITFYEALKELAKKTGIILNQINFQDKTWQKKERFINMNNLASEFFSYILFNQKYGQKAMDYLKSRQIKISTIKSFNLGYAPNSWDSLRNFLRKKKFTDEEMFENGLVIKSEKENYYDRFRGRLIFPIKDSRGFIIGFSGRILDNSTKEAKYVNSPETPVYHKRETLYGINLTKESIKKENNVFLVEGEFDVISPYQYGFTNFVAIKGTALTTEQLLLLKRYTEKITLMLDMDEAGIESTKRAIEEAERLEFDLRIVSLSSGKDPDEAVRSDIKIFKKEISKPVPVYDFLIDIARKRYPEETSSDKKKIADMILPFIEKISNPIVKSYYVKKISNILNVDEESINKMLRIINKKEKYKESNKIKFKKTTKSNRELIIEKYFLSYLFQKENPFLFAEEIFKIISPNDFSQISFQKILNLFLKYKQEKREFVLNEFINYLSFELKSVFDELYLFSSIENDLDQENINKLVLEIRRNSIKRKIKEIIIKEDNQENKLILINLNRQLKELEKNIL
ncbi:MAG: DNA primase [Patescibacteria group bacterium]|nr:DNA primase [Patescibacteria group bacterium]